METGRFIVAVAMAAMIGMVDAPFAHAAPVNRENGKVFIVDQRGERWDVTQAQSLGFDPEGAFIQAWVPQGAIETGALPDASDGKARSNRIVSGESAFSFVNIGGVRYRVGLDTGP